MEATARKRVVWFAVFMLWIGMVAAILIYQEANPEQLPAHTDTQQSGQSTVVPSTPPGINQGSGITSQNNAQTDLAQAQAAKESEDKDFFVQYRLERDKARSENINIYREMINNPNSDPNMKKIAQESLLNLTKDIEQEMEIESLIRAQGFKEALAYKHENSITLIIDKPGFNGADAAKIGDIVLRITDLREEDITILEKSRSK